MPFHGDPLAFYGKRIIEGHHAHLIEQLEKQLYQKLDQTDKYEFFDVSNDALRASAEGKIGILGAGVGGLYTALMLDSLDIEYDILEASDRVGGRLLTHRFNAKAKSQPGYYDYYDAGAMRYPLPKKDADGKYKNGIMKRLAELIEYAPLNTGKDRLEDKLIPYHITARQQPGDKPGFYYFNGIHEDVSSEPQGSFAAEAMKVDANYIKAGAGPISSDVTNPFVRILIEDIKENKKTGWDVMMANDSHSVRSYMASKHLPSDNLGLLPQHLPTNVINWCELLRTSSGGYDLALTESVFSSMAFANVDGNDYEDINWRCFDGGSETLSNKMADYIKGKGVNIQLHKRVTAIKHFWTVIDGSPYVEVTVNGTETFKYSHVISTLPLPVLRTVDLSNADLDTMQKNALRGLAYGPSVKIAILFNTNWWTTKLGIVGGQSFTDLPIRTIVYPSYGVDSSTPSNVLIASYCWTADASRLSALASLKLEGIPKDPAQIQKAFEKLAQNREVLKELVLRNLAEAHDYRNSGITYEYLRDNEFVEMHVKDWTTDEHVMGAYANFLPGEFGDLYTALTAPAAGKRLHFAGEALSTRHGWVVGALDSAWRAVYEYLKVTDQKDKMKQFISTWGENAEWTSKPTVAPSKPKREEKGDEKEKMKWEGAVRKEFDLLDEHLALVDKGIPGGIIPQRKQHK